MSSELQAAYVLHRRVYRETSLLLDVFSVQDGRVSLVAKGAHKAKSYQSASLQAFQPLLMSWSGRSNLKTLNKLEVPSSAFRFVGSKLYCAFYLNELLLNLLPEHEGSYEIFLAYAQALEGLSQAESSAPVLRSFELSLLSEMGLLPDFELDWQENDIDSNGVYYLSRDRQFVRTEASSGGASDSVKQLFLGHVIKELKNHRTNYQHKPEVALGVAEREKPVYCVQTPSIARASRDLMRLLVDSALGGKVLKSRELIKQTASLLSTKN